MTVSAIRIGVSSRQPRLCSGSAHRHSDLRNHGCDRSPGLLIICASALAGSAHRCLCVCYGLSAPAHSHNTHRRQIKTAPLCDGSVHRHSDLSNHGCYTSPNLSIICASALESSAHRRSNVLRFEHVSVSPYTRRRQIKTAPAVQWIGASAQ